MDSIWKGEAQLERWLDQPAVSHSQADQPDMLVLV